MKEYSVRFTVQANTPDEALETVLQCLKDGGTADFLGEIHFDDGTNSSYTDVTRLQTGH